MHDEALRQNIQSIMLQRTNDLLAFKDIYVPPEEQSVPEEGGEAIASQKRDATVVEDFVCRVMCFNEDNDKGFRKRK